MTALVPLRRIDGNLFFHVDRHDCVDLLEWLPEMEVGDTAWIEFPKIDAEDHLISESKVSVSDWMFLPAPMWPLALLYGAPVHRKRVGMFVRAHRLREGPPYKLADWRQLPAGQSMMLSPVECEAEEELALVRQGYFARRGYGQFDVETRDDGSLWVSRQ